MPQFPKRLCRAAFLVVGRAERRQPAKWRHAQARLLAPIAKSRWHRADSALILALVEVFRREDVVVRNAPAASDFGDLPLKLSPRGSNRLRAAVEDANLDSMALEVLRVLRR